MPSFSPSPPRISGFGISVGSAAANRFRFSDKWFHPASGLYDYGFRWHEPATQRWLTRDPLGEWGGFNLYGFVGNSPTGFMDPWGLEPKGHHLFCQKFWNKPRNRVGKDLRAVFDAPDARITDPVYKKHSRGTDNGIKGSEYENAVGSLADAFLEEKGKSCICDLTPNEGRELIDRIKNAKDGVIDVCNKGVLAEKNAVVKAHARLKARISRLRTSATALEGLTAVAAVNAIEAVRKIGFELFANYKTTENLRNSGHNTRSLLDVYQFSDSF